MVVSGSPSVVSRIRNIRCRGQGIVVQRYGTGADFTKVSPSENAHNFSLVPESSASTRTTLGPLPGIQFRPFHAPGSERLVAKTDGDLIRMGVRLPYELQVDYDLQSIGAKLHDHPSWTAFLLAFDVEKLSQLGHGSSLDDLCVATRRLSWVVRACRCSEFVPLEVRSGSGTANISLIPEAVTQGSLVLLRVLICLKEGGLDKNDAGRDWISWGEPLIFRTLPPSDHKSEESHLSATEILISQLRENLNSANSEREDLQERMESATAKCHEENDLVVRLKTELKSAMDEQGIRTSPHAVVQRALSHDALQNEILSSDNEKACLNRELLAAMELSGQRGRGEASMKKELDESEENHSNLEKSFESLQVEHVETTKLLTAANFLQTQQDHDMEQLKKSLKMAEIEHSAAMVDLRQALEKLGECQHAESSLKFSLAAMEAKNSSLQVELLAARKGAALETATQADLEMRLQASEAFGLELKRQLKVANEEHLEAVQQNDMSSPSRRNLISTCSTSASSPQYRRPESSPSSTLPFETTSEIFAASGDHERSEFKWAASRDTEDVRAELEQSRRRIDQLERNELDLRDELVAITAEQFVLNIDLQTVGMGQGESSLGAGHNTQRTSALEEITDEVERERCELKAQLAELAEKHTRLSLALRTPVHIAMVTVAAIVSFKLDSIDHEAFVADEMLVSRFTSKAKEVIASVAGNGVQPNFVEVELATCELRVAARVDTTSAQQVPVQIALSTSSALEMQLLESLRSTPGIESLWSSSTAVSDFRVEVPWPAEVESRLKEASERHQELQSELNTSVQLCTSLVAKSLIHSSFTNIQADAHQERLLSSEREQEALKGEFKDAALRSIVETVTTKLEMDVALDIGRTETAMQQKLQEKVDTLHKYHEESLNALSIAEKRREEIEEKHAADKAGIVKAEGEWLAAMRDADAEQNALRICLTSTLSEEADLRYELEMGGSRPSSKCQNVLSENTELRMHLQHALEEHATVESKIEAFAKGLRAPSLGEQSAAASESHKRMKAELSEARKEKKAEEAEKSKLAMTLEGLMGEHSAVDEACKKAKAEFLEERQATQSAEKDKQRLISECHDAKQLATSEQSLSETRERTHGEAFATLKAEMLSEEASLRSVQEAHALLEASHRDKEEALRNAEETHAALKASHDERDVALISAGEEYAALKAGHVEKDEALLQLVWQVDRKKKGLAKAEEALAALEAGQTEKLIALKEAEQAHIDLRAEHDNKVQKLAISEQEAQRAKEQNDRLHAELEEERRSSKGRCCSQM